MKYDPILEEVHRIKDEIADEYKGDVRKLLADLARAGQSSEGGELIRGNKKGISPINERHRP